MLSLRNKMWNNNMEQLIRYSFLSMLFVNLFVSGNLGKHLPNLTIQKCQKLKRNHQQASLNLLKNQHNQMDQLKSWHPSRRKKALPERHIWKAANWDVLNSIKMYTNGQYQLTSFKMWKTSVLTTDEQKDFLMWFIWDHYIFRNLSWFHTLIYHNNTDLIIQ